MSPAAATGIVLAGGRSTRFGGDKLAAVVDGEPLLHRAIRAVAAVVDEVVVVIGPDGELPVLPADVPVPVVVARDRLPGLGPVAGLAAGLETASAPIALLVGGDQPWLSPAVLRHLLAGLGGPQGDPGCDVVALADGAAIRPLPVAVRVATALPASRAVLDGERHGLFAVVRRLRLARIPEAAWRSLDPDGASLRDVDTPADLPARADAERAPDPAGPADPPVPAHLPGSAEPPVPAHLPGSADPAGSVLTPGS